MAVFMIAFAARLLPVFMFPGINHPDEVFQTIEPAHRLVYGTGLVPWEFVYGTRSWVLPGVLAGFMELAKLLGYGPRLYNPLIGSALAALGAGSALCAFFWGRRFFGLPGALIAGIFTAVWIDNAYFAARTLSDSVAAHLLVFGLYASMPAAPASAARGRAAAAGALLALAGLLRIQLMPAIAILALWSLFSGLRRHPLVFIAGGAVLALAYGGVDAISWGYPFESLWRNLAANLYYGAQHAFGVLPVYWYVAILVGYWTGSAALVLILCLVGAMRLPQPFAAAALICLTLSLIGHKEFRFIYPALLLVVIVAGVGLAQVASWIGEALTDRGWAARRSTITTTGAALALTLLAQLAFADGSDAYHKLWSRGRDMLLASRYVAQLKGVCGIGILDHDWVWTGGYAAFHQPAPLYWSVHLGPLDPDSAAFNTILYDRDKAFGAGYVERACFGEACVAQRPGGCSPAPPQTMALPPVPLGDWQPANTR
ncbi:MAG TPA: hypothetical protein VFQ82_12135 [Stellaceae bacterium]|nr:hypothetical protein [Stellaceae bacterium]